MKLKQEIKTKPKKKPKPENMLSIGTCCRNRTVIRGQKVQDLSALVLSLNIHQWQAIKIYLYVFILFLSFIFIFSSSCIKYAVSESAHSTSYTYHLLHSVVEIKQIKGKAKYLTVFLGTVSVPVYIT